MLRCVCDPWEIVNTFSAIDSGPALPTGLCRRLTPMTPPNLSTPLRIAAAQAPAVPGDVPRNVQTHLAFARTAAHLGVQVRARGPVEQRGDDAESGGDDDDTFLEEEDSGDDDVSDLIDGDIENDEEG